MKKIKNTALAISLFLFVILSGCKKEDKPNTEIPETGSNNSVVFVVNEGSFGSSNGSVSSFYTSTHQVIDDIFMTINNHPLGDVVQSMVLYKDKGYIVVNNSKKIEVVDRYSFLSKGTISGFTSPRYLLPVNDNKAYVSDWGVNNIKVVDLNSFVITDSIPAANGPEQMAMINNKVYVTNIGGYSIDSTLTIIDANTNAVIKTITVGMNPGNITTDYNGKIWVLCNGWYGVDWTGGTADDVAGSLVRINPMNDQIEATLPMGQFDHPLRLAMNKSKTAIYYLMGISGFDGNIFKFNVNSNTLSTAPLVIKNFYGLGIDPLNEDIYGAYSPVFGQSGYIFRYQNDGIFKDSARVGIGPNGFVFNY
ncbi:MAG: YncE family protein [Bacteroidia bacterium]